MSTIKDYIWQNTDKLYKILYDLCHIPAPSHHEEARAAYCMKWFKENGLTGAYVDKALNVILPYGADGKNELTVLAAHTDTVFPDLEPLPYHDDGEKIYCPAVGDDTASMAILMLTAKYMFQESIPTNGILFVLNSCEEGLGNLKGTRQLFKDYKGRIAKFISFDAAHYRRSADRCVGSHRYEVKVITEGGHSWSAFGNKNAIAELYKIVNGIYSITPPQKEGKKATYNIGGVSGGTSINTIAQEASILCEYRSDDLELLSYMQSEFERIFDEARSEGVEVRVTLLGERPCAGNVDPDKMNELRAMAANVIKETTGEELAFHSGSTDCNIPLSLGIPALTMGVYIGAGAHTREEYLIKSSLIPGLEIGIQTAIKASR